MGPLMVRAEVFVLVRGAEHGDGQIMCREKPWEGSLKTGSIALLSTQSIPSQLLLKYLISHFCILKNGMLYLYPFCSFYFSFSVFLIGFRDR